VDLQSASAYSAKNSLFGVFHPCAILVLVYFQTVIKSFADKTTEKLFLGKGLTKKERKTLGALNIAKATERLDLLKAADEKALLTAPFLHYHKLQGTSRYSIDADSRKSKWRITFAWENEELKDVELVKIEDTH
jgi:plasmid maintenance system killer protein